MARKCDICGKSAQVGYSISHAHNKTKKRFYPNIQVVRHQENGRIRRIRACTQCIKRGWVTKPTPRFARTVEAKD